VKRGRAKRSDEHQAWQLLEQALGDPQRTASLLERMPERLQAIGRALEAVDDGRLDVVKAAAATAREDGHLDVALVLEAALAAPSVMDPSQARAAAKRQGVANPPQLPFLDLYRSYVVALRGDHRPRNSAVARAAKATTRPALDLGSRALSAKHARPLRAYEVRQVWPRLAALAQHTVALREHMHVASEWVTRWVRDAPGLARSSARWADLFGTHDSSLEQRFRSGKFLPLSSDDLEHLDFLDSEAARLWALRIHPLVEKRLVAGDWSVMNQLVAAWTAVLYSPSLPRDFSDAADQTLDRMRYVSALPVLSSEDLVWLWTVHHQDWTPRERLYVGRRMLGAAPLLGDAPLSAFREVCHAVFAHTNRFIELDIALEAMKATHVKPDKDALSREGASQGRIELVLGLYGLLAAKPRAALRVVPRLLESEGVVAAAIVASRACSSIWMTGGGASKGLRTARESLEGILDAVDRGAWVSDSHTWADVTPDRVPRLLLRTACAALPLVARHRRALVDRTMKWAQQHGTAAQQLGVAAVVADPPAQKQAMRTVARSIGRKPASERAMAALDVFVEAVHTAVPMRPNAPAWGVLEPLERTFQREPVGVWVARLTERTTVESELVASAWCTWTIRHWPRFREMPDVVAWIVQILGFGSARDWEDDPAEVVAGCVGALDAARPRNADAFRVVLEHHFARHQMRDELTDDLFQFFESYFS